MEEKIETVEQPPVKKRGRPPGSQNKAKKVRKTIQTPLEKLQLKYDELYFQKNLLQVRLDEMTEKFEQEIEFRQQNVRHEIIGYQAVISYLENQLGLKKSI